MPPLLTALVIFGGGFATGVVLVWLLWVLGRWQRAAFERKFPPISDDEFLARCTPGTSPAVALKVRRIIAEFLAVDYERVHPSMSFVEDIGAD
jgi:hypothetical protein